MTIREDIKNYLKEAMIKKNVDLISALRLVIASIKDKDIIAKGKGNDSGINDEEIISLLQTMIKQRKSSIDMYLEGKREDLAKKEQNDDEYELIKTKCLYCNRMVVSNLHECKYKYLIKQCICLQTSVL